ncbi:nucleoside-triphosphate diphosphatase [Paucilactobacillus hokkaidonensis JCM 18461]|uniref:dITP/XTP pyrophosphatase n=2 Tax=Paucilactobacillus hokkaidonensis TaxID=1193095 RepID=A0A0A1GYK1_9LACO|nr:XTP/dITP diphosphatase [Paucilactobacillus hokkaidonensis]KRO10510.1 xanthosine triphosphate pyrophosphatase [Paucilactobacillus hokkaidonensis]BAP86029.1 nucleoside-triphosphate diphosphatase [Paucilactobacillus hokkaidonensis JCM 18461]
MTTIVIATNNVNKAKEYREIMQSVGVKVKTLADFSHDFEINENGNTFEENALIKAQTVVNLTSLPVIADDSGLVVDALDGEPGIHSARYAGDHDDTANNHKLLQKLIDVPAKNRTAHFNTTLVALKPNGQKLVVNGRLDGLILTEPHGQNGFGYDPLFYVPQLQKTLAELTSTQKNEISHRGRAMKKLMEQFEEWWRQS